MKTRDEGYFTAVDQLMTSKHIESTPTVFVNDAELPTTSVAEMVTTIERAVDQGS